MTPNSSVESESVPNEADPSRRVILVMDDEEHVADMLAEFLRGEGYITYVEYNGQRGLEKAQTLSFDLGIIDIMMPSLSGETVIATLRQIERFRWTPFILISAGAHPETQLAGVQFVPKPFEINSLLALIKRQLKA